MGMSKFHGVITALVTPFKNGEVDLGSFKRLLRQQTDQGVKGFVINGTTGESPSLSVQEVKALYDCARSELGSSATLIVGTGSNSTKNTIELSQMVSTWKPDALLTVVPYYNKPPQRGLKAHFEAVANSVNVPLLLYNVPGRTVANLEPATVAELSRHGNIIGIKDATGDMKVLRALREQVVSDFILLSGDDGSCVEFTSLGGQGVISVSSHIIGKEMALALANPSSEAVAHYRERYAEFMRLLYVEANPIPVKAAVHWMGVIASGELRLPLVELDSQYHKEFQACLKNLGKL
jgi:4-hydroxy-tetrahydrodipicolinate synthase